jgi:hypothetical protein
VDFVIVERRQPILIVEAKWGDQDVDRGLRHLKGKFPSAPAWQVSARRHQRVARTRLARNTHSGSRRSSLPGKSEVH